MKISDIKIEGFGVWKDLEIKNLSDRVTVFYGPNEAGKSTLMNFLRSVLYGVTAARREKYLPPLEGGRPGGTLTLATENGLINASRYADRGPTDVGKVTLTFPDGTIHGESQLHEILQGVDEASYTNIFAVGLNEIQELSTLSGTEAARWLYRLTTGLDRISLYDVMIDLKDSRHHLLNTLEQHSELKQLTSRHEQLEGEIEKLIAQGRKWCLSAVRVRELDEEVERLQEELTRTEGRARRLEIAIGLKPLWTKRVRLDQTLETFSGLFQLAESAIPDLNELNERISSHESQRNNLRGQRHRLKEEAAGLEINEMLLRNRKRLEAISEQQDWLEALQRQEDALTAEMEELQTKISQERLKLGNRWSSSGSAPELTEQTLETLRPYSKTIRNATDVLESCEEHYKQYEEAEKIHRAHIDATLTTGHKLGLPTDLEEAGDLVARLRHRLQAEQRLEQARRHAVEIEYQSHELLDDQIIPLWMFGVLWVVTIIGALMLGLGLYSDIPAIKNLGLFGVGGGALLVIGSFLFKLVVEDSASEKLDNHYRQMDVIDRQMEEANREIEQLERELPMTEGSVLLRLQNAERHLSELEKMLPVESKRKQANADAEISKSRLIESQEIVAQAKQEWVNQLRALGLPEDIRPQDLPTMAGQYEQLTELSLRAQSRQDEIERRQREFLAVSRRIQALAEETELQLEDPEATALEQLQFMLSESRQQMNQVAHRDSLKEKARELKREEADHRKAVTSLGRRREITFQKAFTEDEAGYRQLASRLVERDELLEKRAGLSREIAAAIGKLGGEDDFAPLLAPETIEKLEEQWDLITEDIDQIQSQLHSTLERRGGLVLEQQQQTESNELAEKQLDLLTLESQIKLATDAWQERATVGMLLENIRADYEQNRQPETLREANQYFTQLTDGRYVRIWTPLANDTLFVDTAEGQTLPVTVLSRGTREQLFVSLRLALVSMFARRGIQLPMILDDVLVNFDIIRTRTAVKVFRDFAKNGHQLLVFTCHEHIWDLFRESHVDARRIPNRFGEEVLSAELLLEEELEEEFFVPEPELLEPEVEVVVEEPEEVFEEIIEEEIEPEITEPEVLVPEVTPPEPPVKPIAQFAYSAILQAAPEPEVFEAEEELLVEVPAAEFTEVEYRWTEGANAEVDYFHEAEASQEGSVREEAAGEEVEIRHLA